MKVFFLVSGENRTLPKAEVLAVLQSIGAKFRVLNDFDQVLCLDSSKVDISKRLALTHKICELYGSCAPNLSEIIKLVKKTEFKFRGSFAVRVKRVKMHSAELGREKLERDIGEVIWKRYGANVDLKNPENVIYGVLTDEFVLGRVRSEIDKTAYKEREPQRRPYFRPGVMLPKTARAVVNLSRVREGDRFIDPFCGSGGFLIEAALIGAKIHGCDVDDEALAGCEKNLKHYGIKDYKLELRDARTLGREYRDFFDAIATDPPYGISASTRGLNIEKLYKDSINSFYEILKPKRYACVTSPRKLEIKKAVKKTGFEIVEEHFERIHRSLTRRILVLRK